MAKRELPRPTDAELAILRVLWQEGPGDGAAGAGRSRAVAADGLHDGAQALADHDREGAGAARRVASERTSTGPAGARSKPSGNWWAIWLRRAFGGSAFELVMQAIATKKASAEELAEIRKLIENLERRESGGDS